MPHVDVTARRRIDIVMSAWAGLVKADQLAERHGVQPRTIYRDVVHLRESGIPIRGEAGVGYLMPSNPLRAIERNLEQMGR